MSIQEEDGTVSYTPWEIEIAVLKRDLAEAEMNAITLRNEVRGESKLVKTLMAERDGLVDERINKALALVKAEEELAAAEQERAEAVRRYEAAEVRANDLAVESREAKAALDLRNDDYLDKALALVKADEELAKSRHDMARARVELVELRKADKEAETLVSALGASLECRVHEEEETATRESPRLRYDKALCEKAAAWLAAREGKGE